MTKAKFARMTDLIAQLNVKREQLGQPPVKREWTGCAHWLSEPQPKGKYRSLSNTFTDDENFLGFLEGMLFILNGEPSKTDGVEPHLKVSLDGGTTYLNADRNGVRIIVDDVFVSDVAAELHLNVTDEGLIMDVWELGAEDPSGTSSETAQEIVERLTR